VRLRPRARTERKNWGQTLTPISSKETNQIDDRGLGEPLPSITSSNIAANIESGDAGSRSVAR
jgi:hypothetical protein